VRLPYEVAALGMIVVLPDDISGSGAVAHQLGAHELSELFTRLSSNSRLVDLALPRFKANFKTELTGEFQRGGVTLAFDQGKADFSGATERPASEVTCGSVVLSTRPSLKWRRNTQRLLRPRE
jgi:serine protease inhibitor